MTNLQELTERLEKATGPSLDLEREIMYVMRGIQKRHRSDCDRPPAYTKSIDAALKLVPEGWPIENLSWWPKVPREYEDQQTCAVSILEIGPDGFHSVGIDRRDRRFKAVGRNPAIALCIVALKARAALIGSNGA